MSNANDLVALAEAQQALLPDLPEYQDLENPEVTSGSKARHPWRVEDDAAAEWACRRMWEAADEIARVKAEHEPERARLIARLAMLDKRLAEITAGEQRTVTFFEGCLCDWMSRARSLILKGKSKSKKLLYGTIGVKSSPRKIEYDDEKAATVWARAQGIEAGLARVAWTLDKDAVKTFCEATNTLPPSARWVGGEDRPFCRPEAPANPFSTPTTLHLGTEAAT